MMNFGELLWQKLDLFTCPQCVSQYEMLTSTCVTLVKVSMVSPITSVPLYQ